MDTRGESTIKIGYRVTFMTGLLLIAYLSSVLMQPDNYGKIAFVSSRDKDMQIYVMNADGSNLVKISSTNCVCFFPAWSPDGRKIAFTVDCGILAVYVIDADGSNCRNLTSPLFESALPPDCGWPAWSPDGKKIAFVVGNYVCVMDADGSNTQWTYKCDSSLPWSPAWSPDGKKIAFSLGEPGLESIYLMDCDGSNAREITSRGDNPSWSPDGKKIAFDMEMDDNKDIYVMNADGTNVQRLTFDPASDYHPTWSPDGTKIAFVSDRDGNNEIYVMNADGMNQINLTNNPRDDRDPDWCCQSLIEPVAKTSIPSEEPSRTPLPFKEISPKEVAVLVILLAALTIFLYKIILKK